jgi:hypothetical protein
MMPPQFSTPEPIKSASIPPPSLIRKSSAVSPTVLVRKLSAVAIDAKRTAEKRYEAFSKGGRVATDAMPPGGLGS